jgi:ATP synthase protein I
MAREAGDPGQNGHKKGGLKSGETIALMLLAGIAVGLLVGYGLDRLLHTTPVFIMIGVFAGFALALYAVYLETK